MRWMMSCEEARELISAGLDQELPWTRRFLMRIHLSMCKKCSSISQHLRALRDTLLGIPDPELPEEHLPEAAQECIKTALRHAGLET
ncbi:MAG TPA: zf-HC2 domain-containing protein [Candidatus Lambdaproteobacteria bacterium]|nr:zf-HC2 domain-containing protein [Candidatus Lambdaproteobacteria bacterium]